MVTGIDKFQKYFAGHEDHYAIIGGAACDLLFDEVGLDFRATKDIDMVLCVEVVDAAFGTCLLYTSPSPRDATLSRMPSSA